MLEERFRLAKVVGQPLPYDPHACQLPGVDRCESLVRILACPNRRLADLYET
jgi:hypothetical protein